MGLEGIGEYRSLLGEPPSAVVISKLWKMLGGEPSAEVIEHLAENLARWPDDVERRPLGAWLTKANHEERSPALALCDTVDARLDHQSRWHPSEDTMPWYNAVKNELGLSGYSNPFKSGR